MYFIAIVDSRSLAPVSLTPHNSLTDEFSNKHNMILQFLFTSWDSPTRKTLERLLRSFTSLSDEVSTRLSGKEVGGYYDQKTYVTISVFQQTLIVLHLF